MSRLKVIYDNKNDLLFEAYLGDDNKWYMYSEDEEVFIKARTKKNIKLDTQDLFMIGDL